MYVKVRDVRLWFDVLSPGTAVEGDVVRDRPTIIGVHGGPGVDSTGLIEVLEPLVADAQLVRYDQRGHGRSDRGEPSRWTLRDWADDAAGLSTALGIDRPVLLGTSFGARVALACAARHPAAVGGVVAAYGGGRLDGDATVAAFERLGGVSAARAAAGDPTDPEGSFATWLAVCWPLVSRRDGGAAHLQRVQQLSIQSREVHAAHGDSSDVEQPVPGLEAVTCPVLVLGGEDDPLSTPTVMTEFAAALVNSTSVRLLLLAGAGHPVFHDQPVPAYEAVRTFVRAIG